MIKEAINIIVSNINLSEAEMAECMREIMEEGNRCPDSCIPYCPAH